jgi:hypothetical protein
MRRLCGARRKRNGGGGSREILRASADSSGRLIRFLVRCEQLYRPSGIENQVQEQSAAEVRRAKLQADFDRRAVRRFLSWGEVIGSNRSLIAVIPARRPLTACLPYARDPPKSEAAVVFQHLCEMGLEGIVSAAWLARRSGPSTDWLTSRIRKRVS